MKKYETVILGAGMTGLAAGISSGFPIFEAAETPGGICSSYYINSSGLLQNRKNATDRDIYRFEVGGGHWIFGGDPVILRYIENLTPVKRYNRRSSVYFPDNRLFVPYPLQYNLRFLDTNLAAKALYDMTSGNNAIVTLKDWLVTSFGMTLCELFFFPFHELYTGGLYSTIAPQDPYKSPIELKQAISGAFHQPVAAGYNTTFIYPKEGLDTLAQIMASKCDVHYGREVVEIDLESRMIRFANDATCFYQKLISSLPLNKMLKLCRLNIDDKADPYTSVLVLNIGAIRGEKCPEEHWVYVPTSNSGFHRVGFYSNVDSLFLPETTGKTPSRVSIYVERSFAGGNKPGLDEITLYKHHVIRELQDWGFIGDPEAIHSTWIDVAYTWTWPQSTWKRKALEALHANNIFQVGRYGRWKFQGIADSIQDGLFVGTCIKNF